LQGHEGSNGKSAACGTPHAVARKAGSGYGAGY